VDEGLRLSTSVHLCRLCAAALWAQHHGYPHACLIREHAHNIGWRSELPHVMPSLLSRAQLRLPRVIGMLGAGLLLANVPNSPIAAFPGKWGTQMRAFALATIFLRCGLELEFKVGLMWVQTWVPAALAAPRTGCYLHTHPTLNPIGALERDC